MHGHFIWNELATTDVENAMAFYEQTLDWTFEPFALPDGPYWVIKAGDTIVGGLGGLDTAADPQATRPGWFAFIEVDDVDTRIAKAEALGAIVLRKPHDVPNVGRVAVLRDPPARLSAGWRASRTRRIAANHTRNRFPQFNGDERITCLPPIARS